MNPYLQAQKSFQSHVDANLAEGEVLPKANFYDAFQASLGLFIDENLSISRYLNNGVREERDESIKRLIASGDIPSDIAGAYRTGNTFDWDGLVGYANSNLDTDFQTNDQLQESIRETLAQRREYAERTTARTSWSGTLGTIAGPLVGVGMDPINVLGMLATPYRAMQGISVLQNVLRAGGRGAIIAGGTEAAIQPFVMDWKAEIQSPYSATEAIQNIGFAAGFGFTLDGVVGGISATMGRNTNTVREQNFKVSDMRDEMDNIIETAEKNADLIEGDDAAQSALADLKELREELNDADPDMQAAEHFDRIHKQLEQSADDSPRYEVVDFDEFDDSRLDLELQELGDVEMPVRMEVDAEGKNIFETDTINNIVSKADANEERLTALRNCVIG